MRTRRSRSSSDPMSSAHTGATELGTRHLSVLLHEVIELLVIQKSDVVVDATLGGSGHAQEIAKRLGNNGVLIGLDLDKEAIERARVALHGTRPTIHLVEGNFRDLSKHIDALGIESIDKVLFDLGWSSFQLTAERGFSFQKDEPLLMTYAVAGATQGLTASTIVNEWGEISIADILFGWGEERYARKIAKRIVERRSVKPFETARELAEFIADVVPPKYRYGKIHPATKTFQALRIAVNDELGALRDGLKGAWSRLTLGGRIAVISFHSIEDREVKNIFREWEKGGEGKRITKRPTTPSEAEVAANPRSRSAKLRVVQKI